MSKLCAIPGLAWCATVSIVWRCGTPQFEGMITVLSSFIPTMTCLGGNMYTVSPQFWTFEQACAPNYNGSQGAGDGQMSQPCIWSRAQHDRKVKYLEMFGQQASSIIVEIRFYMVLPCSTIIYSINHDESPKHVLSLTFPDFCPAGSKEDSYRIAESDLHTVHSLSMPENPRVWSSIFLQTQWPKVYVEYLENNVLIIS